MKSTKDEIRIKKEDEYPKLMTVPSGLVIQFQSDGNGAVVYVGNSGFMQAEIIHNLDMGGFTDYHGKVILEN